MHLTKIYLIVSDDGFEDGLHALLKKIGKFGNFKM